MSAPIIITVPRGYLEANVGPQVPRKRRLDHLSWEEKMQRKKLKNRVAAQTSRDRKKAKMDDMEQRVQALEEKNERLTEEVANLKVLNERLMSENTALRQSTVRDVPVAPGPAESPQQKVGPLEASRTARLLSILCLISQISSLISIRTNTSTHCKILQTLSSEKLMITPQAIPMSKFPLVNNALKEEKWWGPHQSNWNPVKVES